MAAAGATQLEPQALDLVLQVGELDIRDGGSVAATAASGGGLEVVLRFPDSADSKALPAAV